MKSKLIGETIRPIKRKYLNNYTKSIENEASLSNFLNIRINEIILYVNSKFATPLNKKM